MISFAAATTAIADEQAIQRCREVADPSKRLTCYDAIALPAKLQQPPRQPADQFGLESQAIKTELGSVDSHIVGRFEGWGPKDRITLNNGQVWQVSDDSHAVFSVLNPKVTVRRGSFGAFYLEIAGTNRSPRVTRVK